MHEPQFDHFFLILGDHVDAPQIIEQALGMIQHTNCIVLQYIFISMLGRFGDVLCIVGNRV